MEEGGISTPVAHGKDDLRGVVSVQRSCGGAVADGHVRNQAVFTDIDGACMAWMLCRLALSMRKQCRSTRGTPA